MTVIAAIKGVVELIFMLRDLVVMYRQARAEGWLEDAKRTLDAVKTAKSDDERRRLARELSRVGFFPPS